LVGLNFGTIDPSSSAGNVTTGANGIVGGLVGANAAYVNFSGGLILGSSFPIGTISSDSLATGPASGGPGSTVGPQVGWTYPTTGLPAYPALVASPTCGNELCTILATGQLAGPGSPPAPPPPPNPPASNPPPSTPPSSNPPPPPPTTASFTQPQIIQNLVQNINLAALTLGEVVNTQALNQPPPPPPGPGPSGNNLPPAFGSKFFVVPPPGETRLVQDEVVVQIPSNIPAAQLQGMLQRLGLTIVGSQSLGLLGVTTYRLHIENGSSIGAVVQALADFQIVAGAQANYTYGLVQERARDTSEDPQLAEDPNLAARTQETQEGDAAQYALAKLGLIAIHRQMKGTNVTVAVIDSQIDMHHPDLEGAITEHFDAVGAEDTPHAHGTGMAGAIAAHRRLMGIAPSAKIFAVHAFSSGAASAESTTFQILKGLDWAASKGARVINMSFAGPRDPSLERALKAAHDKGIVLIAAAGNAGPKSPPLYPGADPNVIAVTATDMDDKVFSGANRGKYIAVAAPGVDILVPAPEGGYQLTTGTSVASAEVSGIAALLIERNPDLKPEDIRKILTASARRIAGKERDDNYGSGLVDPSKAIQTAGDLSAVVTGSVAAPKQIRARP
jgi:subtilisin family serine protease